MSYSCCDFTNDLCHELGVTAPDDAPDDCVDLLADLALDAIQNLKNRLAVAEAKNSERLVKLYMEGGTIQDMEVPTGVKVEVYDFDIEGADEYRVIKTPHGEKCTFAD